MMTNYNASMVVRFGGIGRTLLAFLFVMLMSHTALPVSVARAQDNRTRQVRESSVTHPRPPEQVVRPNPDAPAPSGSPERLSLDQAVDRLERDNPRLRLALCHRPDRLAHQLGFWRSQAGWLQAWVELLPDLYILDQPNRPGRADAGGRADVPPPAPCLLISFLDIGHSRGRVARAQINVAKWRIELARVERQIVLDVRHAHVKYTHSLAARRRLKEEVLPSATNVRDVSFRLFQSGETDIQSYLSAQKEYGETVGDYIKAAIRHRRAALALNTAVGKRVLSEST
jgi:hypothetical protein